MTLTVKKRKSSSTNSNVVSDLNTLDSTVAALEESVTTLETNLNSIADIESDAAAIETGVTVSGERNIGRLADVEEVLENLTQNMVLSEIVTTVGLGTVTLDGYYTPYFNFDERDDDYAVIMSRVFDTDNAETYLDFQSDIDKAEGNVADELISDYSNGYEAFKYYLSEGYNYCTFPDNYGESVLFHIEAVEENIASGVYKLRRYENDQLFRPSHPNVNYNGDFIKVVMYQPSTLNTHGGTLLDRTVDNATSITTLQTFQEEVTNDAGTGRLDEVETLVDNLDTTYLKATENDTFEGDYLSFGESTRQMIRLYGSNYGLGVQAQTLYCRSNNHFSWFRQGEHADATDDPGTDGTSLMRLNGDGELTVLDNVVTSSGDVNTNTSNIDTLQTFQEEVTNDAGTGRLDVVETTVSDHTTSIAENADTIEENRERIVLAFTYNDTNEANITTLQTFQEEVTNDAGTGRLDVVETTVSDHTTSITQAQSDIDAVETTVADHTTSIATLGTDIDTNTTNITQAFTEIDAVVEDVDKVDFSPNLALIVDLDSAVTVDVRIHRMDLENAQNYHALIPKSYGDGASLYDYVQNQDYMFATVTSGLDVSDQQLFSIGASYENISVFDTNTYFALFLTHYSSGLPFYNAGANTDVTLTIYTPNSTTNPNAFYSLRHMIEHPRLATEARATPARGDIYVNNSGALVFYSGTEWQQVTSSAV